jgi:hypothetical protein
MKFLSADIVSKGDMFFQVDINYEFSVRDVDDDDDDDDAQNGVEHSALQCQSTHWG